MNKLRKKFLFLMIVVTVLGFVGCKTEDTDVKKIKDLEFTVVSDDDLPGELKKIIDEKKENPFKLSYSNKDYLYIVVGYGKQESGGYSIAVEDLYLTSNAIYIDTNLIGPSQQDLVSQGVTYPYVVVKLEFLDKSVVFN
ncbi:MAG: putative rane protein [Herbinix sp.]|nr:putative rane protein [Herbinix sp.]